MEIDFKWIPNGFKIGKLISNGCQMGIDFRWVSNGFQIDFKWIPDGN